MKNQSEYRMTTAQMQRAMEEFRRVLDSAVPPDQINQLGLHTLEEEEFIQHEVERKLYKPKLPNAGKLERIWLEKLKRFSRDESLVVTIKTAAGRYAAALESLLPLREYKERPGTRTQEGEQEESGESTPTRWMTMPGCYYTGGTLCPKPVTAKTNKALYSACLSLKQECGKDMDKRWLADFLLSGEPEPVSNFKMECLYLLRGADGNVTRLVRLVNTQGETSDGPETGGTDILPAEEFGSAEKFRAWCLRKGNFNWGVGHGAGNIELQMLHSDVSCNAAYKVARLIEYCGWHPVKNLTTKHGDQTILGGIWFNDECGFTSHGEILVPDDDGVIQYAGETYVLARKGREGDFAHGRPKMRPKEYLADMPKYPWMDSMELLAEIKLDKSGWQEDAAAMPVLSGFFREMCRRFHDTAGGMGGWLAVGTALGYVAGPEFFEHYGCLPSIFIPGQMGSGKTFFSNWLMGIQGFQPTKGLGLGKGSRVTPVGLCQQLENYSSLMLWFDEYRQYEISDEKVSIIRDSYDRQLAGKWTPDGVQRVIRTTPLISGETDTSDAATRSRYTHLQISAQQRIGNHVDWMRDNRQYFYLFWRHLMVHRPDFVKMVMIQAASWFNSEDTRAIPERSRVTYSLAYAAFTAATAIFESHGAAETGAFRKFIIAHASLAAEDVGSDVNVNVFVEDLITAVKAEAISLHFFLVEKKNVTHPPDAPNQGAWEEYALFMDSHAVIAQLQIFLRKAGKSVTLRHKDLRDQLSKNTFWIATPKNETYPKRIGKNGQKSTCKAWGFRLDKHPLGYQKINDEAYRDSLKTPEISQIGPVFVDGDPRKGPLFAIIEAVERFEAQES